MVLDQTGVALGTLIADTMAQPLLQASDGHNSLLSPSQLATANANITKGNQAQLQQWIAISKIIVDYIVANGTVTINNVGSLLDSSGHACSGSATGTPTVGGIK